MRESYSTKCSGSTMVELIIAGSVAMIIISAVGVLFDGSSRAWERTYDSVYGQTKDDARVIITTFGNIARKSNRASYILYNVDQGVFTPALPDSVESQCIVWGEAVEFRYWDVELDSSDTRGIMNTDTIATASALFYLENGQFKVDYGPYPPGAVPEGGGHKRTNGITTIVLADNVTADSAIRPFSHTTQTGIGLGCVRLNVVVTDPNNGQATRIMTAAMARNIWPR